MSARTSPRASPYLTLTLNIALVKTVTVWPVNLKMATAQRNDAWLQHRFIPAAGLL
jgi:hypothetical protein